MDPNNQPNYPGLNVPQFQVGMPQPSQFQVLYPAPVMQPMQQYPQMQQQPQFVQAPVQQQIPMQQFTYGTDMGKQNVAVSTQPQVVYFQSPPPQFSEIAHPLLSVEGDPRARLLNQNYQVQIGHWISEGWHLYKEHWIAYSTFTLFYLLLNFIPYIGFFFALCLFPGMLLAGLHQLRPQTQFKGVYFFHGIFYFFPIFGITLLYSLAVMCGLLLFIIPGIWLAVVLSFAVLIYLEHHEQSRAVPIGIFESLSISRKVASKEFCSLFLFFLVVLLLNILGTFTIIGFLVSYPVTNLAIIVGFQHMFGLNQERRVDMNCVCCC